MEDNVKKLISIYYDKIKVGETRNRFEEVKYQEPDYFLKHINRRDSTATNTTLIEDPSGMKLIVLNDAAPTYFTSFDDTTLIMDSFDSAVDSTIRSSKVQAHGFVIPSFTMADGFVPPLPLEAQALLIEDATARAQYKDRQMIDQKAEAEAGRQRRYISQKQGRTAQGNTFRNYGRKR